MQQLIWCQTGLRMQEVTAWWWEQDVIAPPPQVALHKRLAAATQPLRSPVSASLEHTPP